MLFDNLQTSGFARNSKIFFVTGEAKGTVVNKKANVFCSDNRTILLYDIHDFLILMVNKP